MGAWEEEGDTCNHKYSLRCTQHIASSDALCKCTATAVPTTTNTTITTTQWIDSHVGDRVQVRDEAISMWMNATVSFRHKHYVEARPDGWNQGYHWEMMRFGPWPPTVPVETTPMAVGEAECVTVQPGSTCHNAVWWAMQQGAALHPDWYPGLSPLSSFEEFQDMLFKRKRDSCPPPCKPGSAPGGPPPKPYCLCVFDVDRTLTCKQHNSSDCPGTKEMPGILDSAYGGGTLVLSELAVNMQDTFCTRCYRGIVSAGSAGGHHSKERTALLEALGGVQWTLSDTWSPPAPHVRSMLVHGAPDTGKQHSIRGIANWLREHKGVLIKDENVHFFDDNVLNPPPFIGTGFNARQVSCRSRGVKASERLVGLCGARSAEVIEVPGVYSCEHIAEP